MLLFFIYKARQITFCTIVLRQISYDTNAKYNDHEGDELHGITKLARMKSIINTKEQEQFRRSSLKDPLFEKTTSPLINNHYTCCECYAAWFGKPICITCGKEKFVVITNLYSERGKFDVF